MDRQSQIERVLDRYESPRFKYALEHPDVSFENGNPDCADIVIIHLKILDDTITEISFEGDGCTISQASADFLAEIVQGKNIEIINAMDHEDMIGLLGKEIVKHRAKCALLPLDTLKLALSRYGANQT
jgi:nitrogen fixation NifU-like protein